MSLIVWKPFYLAMIPDFCISLFQGRKRDKCGDVMCCKTHLFFQLFLLLFNQHVYKYLWTLNGILSILLVSLCIKYLHAYWICLTLCFQDCWLGLIDSKKNGYQRALKFEYGFNIFESAYVCFFQPLFEDRHKNKAIKYLVVWELFFWFSYFCFI